MSKFSVHVMPEDCPLVTTYKDWLDAQNLPEPVEYGEEADYIEKILTMDYCHWMLRRTSGLVVDGSHAESAWDIRKKMIAEYESKFEKTYFDINEGETH